MSEKRPHVRITNPGAEGVKVSWAELRGKLGVWLAERE